MAYKVWEWQKYLTRWERIDWYGLGMLYRGRGRENCKCMKCGQSRKKEDKTY